MKTIRITWCPPIGDGFAVAPASEELSKAILHSGAEFWEHPDGCFDGGLYFDVDSVAVAELKLMFAAPDRFCVLHHDCTSFIESIVSSENPSGKMITVRPGGNPWQLPDIYFVHRNTAWRAVEFFLINGGQCPDLPWVPFEPPEI